MAHQRATDGVENPLFRISGTGDEYIDSTDILLHPLGKTLDLFSIPQVATVGNTRGSRRSIVVLMFAILWSDSLDAWIPGTQSCSRCLDVASSFVDADDRATAPRKFFG